MKFSRIFNRKTEFRARSSERDRETDRKSIEPILQLIQTTLQTFDAERTGLETRIAAAGLRASFLVGNDTDEYLSRDAEKSEQLRQVEAEFKNGHRRLEALRENIVKLEKIHMSVLDLFPIAQASQATPDVHNYSSANQSNVK